MRNNLPLLLKDAAEYLKLAHNLPIRQSALRALAAAGRGPALVGSRVRPAYPLDVLDKWADCYFTPGHYEATQDGVITPCVMAEVSRYPSWLVVHEMGPDGEFIVRQLEAAGAWVMGPTARADTALRAALSLKLDAAHLYMDWNMEAAIIVVDALVSRGIPFIIDSFLEDVPDFLREHGTIRKFPYGAAALGSAADLGSIIERRMPAIAARMEIAKIAMVDMDGDLREEAA